MTILIGMILGFGMGAGMAYWLGYRNRGYIYNIGLCLLIPIVTAFTGTLAGLLIYHAGYDKKPELSAKMTDEIDPIAQQIKREQDAADLSQTLRGTIDTNPDTAGALKDETFDDLDNLKGLEDSFSFIGAESKHKPLSFEEQRPFMVGSSALVFGLIGAIWGLRRKIRIYNLGLHKP